MAHLNQQFSEALSPIESDGDEARGARIGTVPLPCATSAFDRDPVAVFLKGPR